MMHSIKHYFIQIKNGRLKEFSRPVKWVFGYMRRHLISITLYTFLGLTGTVVGLLSSLVSRDLVDIITGHHTGKLITTFALMIITQLATSAISQLSSYLSTKISLKVENSIKADMYEQIMTTEWEALSGYHSGELVTRWSSDTTGVSNGLLNLAPNTIIYIFRFIATLIMVIKYDISFALIAFASVPISILSSKQSMKRMQRINMDSLNVGTRLSAFTQESFTNFQTLKAFDLIHIYFKRLRSLQQDYSATRLKYQKATIINSLLAVVISMAITYFTYGWGIYKVWNGVLTYGTMTMFLSLSGSLTGTIQSIINLVPSTISLVNSAKRLLWITDLPKEDYSQKSEVSAFFEKHRNVGVGIRIQDSSYTYATGTEVFQQVNLEAYPKEIIALVGPSGEGKTTMLRLFLSIIHPQEGMGYICAGHSTPEITSDCMEITASTRQLFAYVPQGNTMFSGTIADNMRNVKEDATDEEIIHALELACAWDFVSKLPDGINTMMQERGGGFSEGQAQRLSIARALIRRSPILLLDEATSALDVYTEKKVLQNIMQDDYPRTTIVTTHRPSVLSVCTRVYAIRDKGCDVMGQAEIEDMANAYK